MGMRILAIDPGTHESGWVILDDGKPDASGIDKNLDLLETIASRGGEFGKLCDVMAVEMIASYGMPVGKEVFETCVWIGRFLEQWAIESPNYTDSIRLIYRKDVKMHLCGTTKAKDPHIRQRLIDLLGPAGTKKSPGPTYGIKSHVWPALAVGVTAAETNVNALQSGL
jgi:hypothetical protein